MAKVLFKRVESSDYIDNINVEDGNFIVTGDGRSYIDYGENRIAIAGTPDTTMSDISTNAVANKTVKEYVDTNIETVNNNIHNGFLLWTNPNPNNVIQNATTITFSSSDYDVIEVFYKTANDGSDLETSKTIKGYNLNMSASGYQGAGLRRRLTYNNDTSWTIGVYNGETLADSGTGKYIIPVYIIGYKTGLFS